MAKFKVTFFDEMECENEDQCIDVFLDYLNECVRNEDVTAFKIEQI
jgi:hypothetical protein